MARMRVALRRRARVSDGALDSAFSLGGLQVDLAARRVTVAGVEVHLTPIEYRLLVSLVHHAGSVITHRQLLGEVWGPNATEQAHYLRVYMAHLRRKLEADAARPRYLLTEAGGGYRLPPVAGPRPGARPPPKTPSRLPRPKFPTPPAESVCPPARRGFALQGERTCPSIAIRASPSRSPSSSSVRHSSRCSGCCSEAASDRVLRTRVLGAAGEHHPHRPHARR